MSHQPIDPITVVIMVVSFVIFAVPFAYGANILAHKLGANRWAWTACTLIPGVNFVFGIYVSFRVVFHVVDSLRDVREAIALPVPASGDPA